MMFTPATQTWFEQSFEAATEVQRRGWESIRAGRHALLVAPTGSGKTLAAFLAAIDRLVAEGPAANRRASAGPGAAEGRGTSVVYVSPLKALVYDIERNLRAPLAGIRRTSARLGLAVHEISVSVRTGDTPSAERTRQARHPGDILVTTPESLFLILGSGARANLATVRTIIVDEVHALAPTKRGAHLAISLERLCALTREEPQRIGLSATARPIDEIARFLGGDRPVEIVDASARPRLDLAVVVPVADMTNVSPPDAFAVAVDERASSDASSSRDPENEGGPILGELYDREIHTPFTERGVWPAIYPEILRQVRENRSTIVFVNSRGLCERLAQRLNDLAGEEIVRAHHGSVSQEKRREIEESLKRGILRGIVATSSLELGIDMGAVDRVVLVESPGSVARGLQRVGRAGHQVGEISVGRLYPKHRGDLLEAAVITARMLEGDLEASRVPRNALDVLAQQAVAICADTERTVDELESMVRRAYPFAELSRSALVAVLDMLSGRYPSSEFADLRPLLVWDRARDVLGPRRGAALVSRMNPGTIPDRGHFAVFLAGGGPRVGELDEEMVYESRAGDRIQLGATTWRVEEIQRDRVTVSPAPGEAGRLPFWKGEGPGRPIEVGRSIGAFLREAEQVPNEALAAWIRERAPLDALAAGNLAAYLGEQIAHTGLLPTDRTIVVERFRDELGDWRICLLTPFGARVHAPWSIAIQRRLSQVSGFDIQTMYSEDGIVLRLADRDEPPELDALLPPAEEVEDLVTEQLPDAALFAGLFRENAVRSLLMPRRGPTRRNPLWAQRIKAQQLLASVRQYPSFPVVLETYREALRDVFDLPSLKEILRDIQSRRIRVREVETPAASPFARSLVFAYVAAYLYEQDAPLAERRAQALTVDRNLLSELLGQAELRELIDPRVLEEVEDELQGIAEGRRARDADTLHGLLRRIGDLSAEEIEERSEGSTMGGSPAGTVAGTGAGTDAVQPGWIGWTEVLERSRRAARVRIAGQTRWIAAEDAGMYRDGLGVMPPAGLPEDFLQVVPDALTRIVRRFARRRGPFLPRDPMRRYDLDAAQILPVLEGLERAGTIVRGEIRPGGFELDYCDAEVLRQIKRRMLAALRREVAAVEPRMLGAHLPRWHRVGSRERGAHRLIEAIAQLQGLPLPWSDLTDAILPLRVPGFTVEQLDQLSSGGEILWVGHGPLGTRDGRVALYLREQAPSLLPDAEEWPGPAFPDGMNATSGERSIRPDEPETRPAGTGSTPNGRDIRDDGPDADPDGSHRPLDGNSAPDTRAREVILRLLTGRGASFEEQLEASVRRAIPELSRADFRTALWDLVWEGRITNDTFGPLEDLRWPARARFVAGGSRPRRGGIRVRAGRWWVVQELYTTAAALPSDGQSRRNDTGRALAWARLLLDRYGIVGREIVRFETWRNGFGPLYQVYKALEDRNQVRRGYFVEGMSGIQFADPAALEQLRALRARIEDHAPAPEDVVVLASVDPANPYGALLPWPSIAAPDPQAEGQWPAGPAVGPVLGDQGTRVSAEARIRPRRVAGSFVVLVAGRLALHAAPRQRRLIIFHEDTSGEQTLPLALQGLRRLPRRGGRRRMEIEEVNGVAVRRSPHYDLLVRSGFHPSYRGLVDGGEG